MPVYDILCLIDKVIEEEETLTEEQKLIKMYEVCTRFAQTADPTIASSQLSKLKCQTEREGEPEPYKQVVEAPTMETSATADPRGKFYTFLFVISLSLHLP